MLFKNRFQLRKTLITCKKYLRLIPYLHLKKCFNMNTCIEIGMYIFIFLHLSVLFSRKLVLFTYKVAMQHAIFLSYICLVNFIFFLYLCSVSHEIIYFFLLIFLQKIWKILAFFCKYFYKYILCILIISFS